MTTSWPTSDPLALELQQDNDILFVVSHCHGGISRSFLLPTSLLRWGWPPRWYPHVTADRSNIALPTISTGIVTSYSHLPGYISTTSRPFSGQPAAEHHRHHHQHLPLIAPHWSWLPATQLAFFGYQQHQLVWCLFALLMSTCHLTSVFAHARACFRDPSDLTGPIPTQQLYANQVDSI